MRQDHDLNRGTLPARRGQVQPGPVTPASAGDIAGLTTELTGRLETQMAAQAAALAVTEGALATSLAALEAALAALDAELAALGGRVTALEAVAVEE
ncbi:hypothetical protein GRI97_10710 [Altererythrobacter xixiisoli]|uniref:Uncharacterized protein n=1 Tax=Croceibacterium xixiisoli TaxID=1476466 RepID=A0A6I4TW73_9SPHN|nr:hypothetical protein [Croceibacterium xixiisoli]MXO99459.1 hypothetical protein [Croceibacterium xixiisoli]